MRNLTTELRDELTAAVRSEHASGYTYDDATLARIVRALDATPNDTDLDAIQYDAERDFVASDPDAEIVARCYDFHYR